MNTVKKKHRSEETVYLAAATRIYQSIIIDNYVGDTYFE